MNAIYASCFYRESILFKRFYHLYGTMGRLIGIISYYLDTDFLFPLELQFCAFCLVFYFLVQIIP